MAGVYREYTCDIVRVVDGDTVTVRIAFGFGLSLEVNLRIEDVNAPEMDTAEGMRAKYDLEKLLAGRKNVPLQIKLNRNLKEVRSFSRYVGILLDEKGLPLVG